MGFDMLAQVGLSLVAAGAIYGGIRGDLRSMHERINAHTAAIDKLHDRIDKCVARPGRRRGD